jgi:Cu(I)/Ag(I) efflux system periplasmic protein CusF
MKRYALVFTSLILAVTAHAQSGDMRGGMKDMDVKMEKGAKKAPAKSHHATGVVKSVNAEKGTVSIDHEAVSSMNWPAMNMSFKAKDKKMLQAVKPGAKVEFDFEQHGKEYVITKVN